MSDPSGDFFNYTSSFVNPTDIAAFVPCDPGYPNYVRAFCEILETRKLPKKADFDITETVGLTRWTDANAYSDPTRFRRFRIFTNAVAMSMLVRGHADDFAFPPNYTTISLIDDSLTLRDEALCAMLLPAFEQAHEALIQQKSEEAIFALLATLLIGAKLGISEREMDGLANRLIQEESHCPDRTDTVFVFGCTCYNQLHSVWKKYIQELIRPATPNLALVRDALLNDRAVGA